MCECFLCRNKDNKDMLYGYLAGQAEVLQHIVRELENNGIKQGMIHEKTLEGLLACCKYNLDEVNWLKDQLSIEINSVPATVNILVDK